MARGKRVEIVKVTVDGVEVDGKVCTKCGEVKAQGHIYTITNEVNGKVYVGQTRRPVESRFREHLKALRAGRHYNTHLQHSFIKYGKAAFTFKRLYGIPVDELDIAETREITVRNSADPRYGYNMKMGGIGASYPDTVKERISVAVRSFYKNANEETIARIRARQRTSAKRRWLTERRLSDEDVIAIYTNEESTHQHLADCYGVSRTVIRNVRTGLIYSDITSKLPASPFAIGGTAFRAGHAVIQSSLGGRIVRIWPNASIAEKEGGFVRVSIQRCCKKVDGTYRGFRWRYYSEAERELSALGVTGNRPNGEHAEGPSAA